MAGKCLKSVLSCCSSAGIFDTIKTDYRQALANLQKSYDLLTEENSDKYDKREVYTFMAASYEKLGEIDKAIELYRKTQDLFPQNKELQEKVDSLLSKIQ